ncbi:MAG TPA: LysE family transporter [Acidiferrobacter sp.]|nr:LysE family transporter [Acidiferrobacter sp.]
MELFLFGLIIGVIASAPIGPVGLLTIQRTLAQGRFAGILSGAGAATADALYGALASLSLSAVSSFLASARFWIHISAGILCLWFGGRAIFFRPMRYSPKRRYSGRGLVWNYLSCALLTLANPLTILFFIVVFTTLQLDSSSALGLLSLTVGVFSGCLLWWTILSLVTARLHKQLHSRTLVMINRISAIFIIVLGIVALASAKQALTIGQLPWRPPTAHTALGLLDLRLNNLWHLG